MIKLASSIQIDMSLYPLNLPLPDGINNGGYMLPGFGHAYSQIDLLIAGLEASNNQITIVNLTQFFDKYRLMCSMSWVSLTIFNSEEDSGWQLQYLTVSELKAQCTKNNELLTVLRCNAPLTFKWI
jgi:hypothetical protein